MPRRTSLLSIYCLSVTLAALSTAAMGAATVSGTISHGYPQPMPESFSPASGAPGTVITVTGKGFTGLTQVWIGASKNSPIQVVSDTVVKVTVQQGATTAHLGFINPQHSWFTSENFTVAGKSPTGGTVSGTVKGPTNTQVSLDGASSHVTGVGSGGSYRFTDVADGTYTLSPQVAGHVFTPASVATKVSSTPVSNMNFSASTTSSPTYKISGAVSGSGAVGATVTLNGANVGSAVTNLGGNYSFSGLSAGTYTLSAALPGNTFSVSHTVTLGNVDSNANNFSSAATPAGDLRITTVNSMPAATVGKAYSANVVQSVSGGKAPYRFQTGEYATGAPPVGMILSSSGTLSGTPQSTGTYRFEVCSADAAGSLSSVCAPASITVGSGTTTPPPPGTSWVYYDGVFDWPGDYSFVATPDYADASGGPLSGPYDIKVTLEGAWGGWLPYAKNWDFNSAGYTKLTFALKPTVANQVWQVYFVKVGDVPVGIYLDVTKYGPAPVPGKWATYTVPLSDLGVLGTSIYKFCIQDLTGLSRNTWYVDNVGFAP
jgi:hypothetical protein